MLCGWEDERDRGNGKIRNSRNAGRNAMESSQRSKSSWYGFGADGIGCLKGVLGLILGEFWSPTPAVATTRRDYTTGTRCEYEEVDLFRGFLLQLVSFRNGHLCVCNGIVRERGRDFL